MQCKLSAEESQLFIAAAEAAAAYQRWRGNGDSRQATRVQTLKRKWAAEGGAGGSGSGNENAAANAP